MKYLRGFTLVELLIVIAIVSIMAGAVLVFLGGSKTQKEIDVAAEELVEYIRDMKRRALAGDPDVTSDKACAFGVYFSSTGAVDRYKVFYAKSAASCPTAYTNETNTPTIETRVSTRAQFTASAQSIVFSAPFGEVVAGGGAEITVSHVSGSGTSKCVTVSGAGAVSVSDGVCP